MAKIVTTIRTYFEDGYYRNNDVELEIPDEAAEIIRKAWTAKDGPLRQNIAIRAKYLSKNQSANALLFLTGEATMVGMDCFETPAAGMTGMRMEDSVNDETITRRFDDDED